MIDFRYHVVSIVAVFLALATGLVLGASLLNGDLIKALDSRTASLAADKEDLRTQLEAMTKERDALESLTAQLGPLAVRDQLVGQNVVIVTLPRADSDDVAAVRTMVANAAGEVTAQIGITSKWVADGEASVLDGLAVQLVPDGVTLPSGTAYDRAAALLAAALVTETVTPPDDLESIGGETPTISPPPADGGETTEDGVSQQGIDAIIAGLQAGGFISYRVAPSAPANLAIIVAGPPDSDVSEDTATTTNNAWIAVADELDTTGLGAVVSGPDAATGDQGVLTAVIDSDVGSTVSTVSGISEPSGQVATVLALAAEFAGDTGHFGINAPDGPLPKLDQGG